MGPKSRSGGVGLSQTSPIPRSPDGDKNSWEHWKTPKIIWYHPENNWGTLIDDLVWRGFQQSDQKVGGVRLCQTRLIPRSPDGDNKVWHICDDYSNGFEFDDKEHSVSISYVSRFSISTLIFFTCNAGMKFAYLQSESVVGHLGALYFVGVTGRGPYLLGSALLYFQIAQNLIHQTMQ